MTVTMIEFNKRRDGNAVINGFSGIGKYNDFKLRLAIKKLPYVKCNGTYVHESDIDRLCAFVAEWAGVETTEPVADDMPELAGSEKQVNWAIKIRQAILAAWADHRASINGALAQHMDDIIADATQQTSAKWWIDRRPIGNPGSAEFAVGAKCDLHGEAKRRHRQARA